MTKNKETVLEKAKRIYPENLFGESFNDGPLGGCNVFGDPATHYPIMWKYLTEKLDIRSVIDIGCGFGYSLSFFKDNLGLKVIGIEGSKKVAELALNSEHIIQHDYSKGPLEVQSADLAWSSEFVEHVEEKHIDNFVQTFKCAKYLAITYAHPMQSGHHHVNENTQDYWIDILSKKGFRFDNILTEELRAKTLEDFNNPTSPVVQSCMKHWKHALSYPYHFERRGLFFINEQA